MKEDAHPLVRLATEAIRTFVEELRVMEPPADFVADLLPNTASSGVFVCLKRGGELRGCIGTIEPTKATLIEEVIGNAIAAASRDPRFPSLQPHELQDLMVSVDLLSQPEPIADFAQLDYRRFGVLVRGGAKQGVLLPDIEGISSVEEQVLVVRQKAGLAQEEMAEYFRFEVTRYL